MSFRLKTVLGIAAIEAIMLLILIWNSLLFLAASNEAQLIKRADTTATLFATTTKDAVLSTDLASLEEFVHEVLKNSGIVYARVIGTAGILAQSGTQDILARPFVEDHQFDTVDDGIFDTTAQIEEGGIVFGRVELGISIANIRHVLSEAREQISLIAMLEMMLTALFSLVLGTVLTRRILTLKQASENVAAGDLLGRVLVKGKDEIAVVGTAFNSMLDKLNSAATLQQQYQQQLQDLNSGLEERVASRTAELESSNQALTSAIAELADKAEALEHINQELDQFAYVVSHDLKAPLRAIANLSEWIEEDIADTLTEDTHKQMTLLRGRVARMGDLINGILKYSRVGRVDADIESVDVNELLAEIIDGLVVPDGFVIDIAPDMPVFNTMRIFLSQVFANLLSNAIKYHHQPEHGHVQVSVRDVDSEFYEFSVRDDGPGIAAKYHDKVFGIFQTLNTRDDADSTGVGLSIVKKIVKSQGGEIYLESAENEGSTFRFTVPKVTNKEDNEATGNST